ncbi:MAG TPA: autotransporter-associated beta strand repeat-containing protein, partial [Polymorphobacter sp.]|nr:autotransporter-associated beta strand repeat-containing protein [Polymorphobacter sp.]
GTNTHAGTAIGAGATLVAGSDANLGTAALDFAGTGATLQFVNANNFTHDMTFSADGAIDTNGLAGEVSGVISGAGVLDKTGAGTLTLSNAANSFAGLDISQGQVDVTSAGATGGGTINFNTGTLGLGGFVPTLANDLNAVGTGTIVSGGSSVDLTGAIAGSGQLTLSSTGFDQFSIAGANAGFTGTLTASNVFLVVGDPDALGASGGAILELDANANIGSSIATELTIANDIHLINNTGSYVDTATDITFTGDITDQSGNSFLDVKGGGIVTFAGANNAWGNSLWIYPGTANITGGLDADVQVLAGGTLAGDGVIITSLTNVQNGGIVNPGDARVTDSIGTLTVGDLTLASGSLLNWDFNAPGTNDQMAVNGNLTLDGTLNVHALSGFALGTYTLFTYSGALTNNVLSVPTLPSFPGVFFGVDTTTLAGTVYLIVSGNITQYWDGVPTIPTGAVEGGSGTWDSASTNWTDQTGSTNGTWNGIDAVFSGVTGTITVSGTQAFTSLYFQTDSYSITGGTLDGAASAVIMADAGLSTTIASTLTGIGTVLDIDYAGSTLTLSGDSSFTGDVNLNAGSLGVGHDNALGLGGVVTLGSGTTLFAATPGINLTHDIVLAGNATLDSGATGAPNGLNIYGSISGAGGLTKTGASNLLLTQDNTYLGDTNINVGTVIVDTNGAFSTGHVNLADTTGVSTNGADVALANDISLAAGNSFFTAIGVDVLTLNGLIDGLGGLNADGSGTVVLTDATNSFSGNVFVDTGTLSVSADGNLGALTNSVTLTNGATLLFTGSFTSARGAGFLGHGHGQ